MTDVVRVTPEAAAKGPSESAAKADKTSTCSNLRRIVIATSLCAVMTLRVDQPRSGALLLVNSGAARGSASAQRPERGLAAIAAMLQEQAQSQQRVAKRPLTQGR